MKKDIWVFIEQVEGKVANVSLELLNEAVRIKNKMKQGGKVAAIVLGSNVEEITKTVAEYGAEKIYAADNKALKLYHPQQYATLVCNLMEKEKPFAFLFGSTYIGSHLAPMVAAKIKAGVAAHSIELKVTEEDELIAVVPAFGGKVLGDILWAGEKCNMVSIKGGILPKAEKMPVEADVEAIDLEVLKEVKTNLKPVEITQEEIKGVPLEEAEIVVCGGWGIGEKETWEVMEKVANKLGAAIACTRPPIDEGWGPGEHMMIGTSGKSIKPKIYIGFGISGATHHVCGMKDAGLIISVNSDEHTEMFKASDYGIVGDAKKILPTLLDALNGEINIA